MQGRKAVVMIKCFCECFSWWTFCTFREDLISGSKKGQTSSPMYFGDFPGNKNCFIVWLNPQSLACLLVHLFRKQAFVSCRFCLSGLSASALYRECCAANIKMWVFFYPLADHILKGLQAVKTNCKGNLDPEENETHNTAHFSESACN